MGRGKKPSRAFNPQASKVPRGGSLADNMAGKPFAWTLESIDLDGPFGWHAVPAAELLTSVIPRLLSLQTMTWSELLAVGCHEIEITAIVKEARERLTELGYEIETIYSVRVTGRCRVFGVKDGAIFRVLWWDPEHQICPSQKKHT